jgi:hypothetical protein
VDGYETGSAGVRACGGQRAADPSLEGRSERFVDVLRKPHYRVSTPQMNCLVCCQDSCEGERGKGWCGGFESLDARFPVA